MGLGSSKVDAYVLKVMDDSARDMEMTHRKSKHQSLSASDSHIKQQQQQRGSKNRKNSKVSVHHAPSVSDLDASHSDMIEGPHFLQKKSGTGLIGGLGTGISSKHLIHDDDANNDVSHNNHHHQHHHHSSHHKYNNNSSSSSSSINQSSSKLITRANSIISHSSSKYPWLMKNTNLNGTTLNDYESGKVIGMLLSFFSSTSS